VDLFGEASVSATTLRAAAAAQAAVAPATRRRAAAAGAGGSEREAELLGTIATLTAALEKLRASSTPTTQYMAVRARRALGPWLHCSSMHHNLTRPLWLLGQVVCAFSLHSAVCVVFPCLTFLCCSCLAAF
jgi:hypothetical protein